MTILIRRLNGVSKVRLRQSLELFGKATVTDVDTKETFEVHVVDGELVILNNGSADIAQTIAVAAIQRAAKR